MHSYAPMCAYGDAARKAATQLMMGDRDLPFAIVLKVSDYCAPRCPRQTPRVLGRSETAAPKPRTGLAPATSAPGLGLNRPCRCECPEWRAEKRVDTSTAAVLD